MKKHTFAICAYKESPYLEECIISIREQKIKSEVIMITSTPNDFIEKMCKKYVIPLYVNEKEGGITQDWNFAYEMSKTELVTIAHQDDLYLPEYTWQILKLRGKIKKPLIFFTAYGELRGENIVLKNRLLLIKRIMLFPLRIPMLQNSIFVRRRILSLGNPICCPSVAFDKNNLPDKIFKAGFRSDEDWEAWEILSRNKGAFVYSHRIGMYHRIHKDSETSAILGDNARTKEDFTMFCKFWPRAIARLLSKIYAISEKSNEL